MAVPVVFTNKLCEFVEACVLALYPKINFDFRASSEVEFNAAPTSRE
jgi:hypothetical protein